MGLVWLGLFISKTYFKNISYISIKVSTRLLGMECKNFKKKTVFLKKVINQSNTLINLKCCKRPWSSCVYGTRPPFLVRIHLQLAGRWNIDMTINSSYKTAQTSKQMLIWYFSIRKKLFILIISPWVILPNI